MNCGDIDRCLFNHLGRLQKDLGQDGDAKLLVRLQVDHQLELGGYTTGRTACLVPFRILSLYRAACLPRLTKLAP